MEMDKEQKKMTKEIIEEMEKEQEKISNEITEEQDMVEEIDKEQKKISKEMIKEMEKELKVRKEEVKKILKEKKEELNKVGKEMNEELEEFEDTIREAREKYIMEMKIVSVDGVKGVGEVDEKPLMKECEQRFSGENVELESAMLCLTLQEEAAKDPNESAASGQARPKRVRKPNSRYIGPEWV